MPRLAIIRHQPSVISETFVLEQAKSFRAYEPVLVTRDAPTPSQVLSIPVPVTSIEASQGKSAARAYVSGLFPAAMTRTLREVRADAILAHFGVEGSMVLASARSLGVPLATIFHGFDASYSTGALIRAGHPSWLTYVRKRRALQRHGDLFLPVSSDLRSDLLRKGFPEARTITHHTGVDLAKVRELTPAPEPGHIVHVARLVEKKGTSVLLHAIARLKTQGIAAQLTCVGDGPLRASLEQLVATLGIKDDVTFVGALPNPDVLQILARASCLCVPSVVATSGDKEGTPHVLLEAGALGLPIVASDVGGIAAVVKDRVTGRLVEGGNVDQLTMALGMVLRDRDFAAKVGAAVQSHVRDHFDVEVQTVELERMLLDLTPDDSRTTGC